MILKSGFRDSLQTTGMKRMCGVRLTHTIDGCYTATFFLQTKFLDQD